MSIRIVPIGDDPVIRFAASELHRYIKRMDPAADIMITKRDCYNDNIRGVIWLGMDAAFASRLPGVPDARLDDAVLISVRNSAGIVTGTNARAVLIAVYRLLRENGCSFVRAGDDGDVIPRRPADSLCAEVCEAASCRHRAVCIEGAVSYENVLDTVKWIPKVGMNGYYVQFFTPHTFFERWYAHRDNPTLRPEPLSDGDVQGMLRSLVDEIKLRGLLYHAVGHGWTCEPFGVPGASWEKNEKELPEAARRAFAEVNGVRELWHGVALNTNLCYSKDWVRATVNNAIADYCEKNPAVDYVHFWLADGTNNHCECPDCRETRPADYYVKMLNELDEMMTARSIPTKVVFLIYVDLLWEPEHEKINNPGRFTLMFAPITRTYSKAFTDFDRSAVPELEPYVRNRLTMPRSVEENIARLSRWQAMFPGDSFDFDYHFMWDHFKDPGYYSMAKVLTEDMKGLKSIGINGMVSCQNQRVYLPTGLGMHMMAAALWDNTVDFDTESAAYFAAAFGEGAADALAYCKTLSELFDPVALRREKPLVGAENAEGWSKIAPYCETARLLFEKRVRECRDPSQRRSWEYLALHCGMASLLGAFLAAIGRADGREKVLQRWEELIGYLRGIEPEVRTVFDFYEFYHTYQGILQSGLEQIEI